MLSKRTSGLSVWVKQEKGTHEKCRPSITCMDSCAALALIHWPRHLAPPDESADVLQATASPIGSLQGLAVLKPRHIASPAGTNVPRAADSDGMSGHHHLLCCLLTDAGRSTRTPPASQLAVQRHELEISYTNSIMLSGIFHLRIGRGVS